MERFKNIIRSHRFGAYRQPSFREFNPPITDIEMPIIKAVDIVEIVADPVAEIVTIDTVAVVIKPKKLVHKFKENLDQFIK